MIGKIFSTVGIVFVASLLLVGCDEAAEEASKSGSTKQESASVDEGRAGSSMKAESELTEDEKKKQVKEELKALGTALGVPPDW